LRRFLVAVAIMLISIFLITSCQARSTPPSNSNITITDALNRSVKLERIPERIVIAGKASFMLLDAFYLFPEARERIFAYSGGGINDPARFLPLVDPSFSAKKTLDYEVSPEQILALKPDLVVMKSYLASKTGRSLENLGVRVVYLDMETVEQFLKDIHTIGAILGNPQRAKEIESYYQEKISLVENRVSSQEKKLSLLVAQYSEKGGTSSVSVPPADWIQTELARMAGGKPVWEEVKGGGWSMVNFEQIAVWNPERIFIVYYGGDSRVVCQKLRADAKWQGLSATKGNLFGFPGDFYSWDQPDPRWVLGLLWIAEKTYPQIFSDLDIKKEAADFFLKLYRIDAQTYTEKMLPELKGDLD